MAHLAITVNDLNGDFYLGAQEGEELKTIPVTGIPIRRDFPVAANPFETPVLTDAHVKGFIAVQVQSLITADATITVEQAAIIAYHRLCGVARGLISPAFVPATYHVAYNDANITTDQVYDQLIADFNGVNGRAALVSNALTAAAMQKIRATFTDRVCMIAYVFRVRGHHYLPPLEELYTRLWKKCRYEPGDLFLTNQHLAVHAFHAIVPSILDDFWANAIQRGECNGALAKRFLSAPAGFAAPNVIMAGIRDMTLVAPGLTERLADDYQYLQAILAKGREHRWAGSVNAKYYGAGKVQFDEARLGAMAATIYSAYTTLTQNAPLQNSPALQRVANNAPVTGAVLARAIRQIADRPETVNALMLTSEERKAEANKKG